MKETYNLIKEQYKSLGKHIKARRAELPSADDPFRDIELSGKEVYYFQVTCRKGDQEPVKYYTEHAANPGTPIARVYKAAVAPFVPEEYSVSGVDTSIFKQSKDKWIPYKPASRHVRTIYSRVTLLQLTREEFNLLAPHDTGNL